jgi:hypothetical protein
MEYIVDKVLQTIGAGVIIAALIAGLSVLFAFPTMWMVNYLFAPSALIAVFGHAHLTFWNALWLNVLCGLLFKGSSTSPTTEKTK